MDHRWYPDQNRERYPFGRPEDRDRNRSDRYRYDAGEFRDRSEYGREGRDDRGVMERTADEVRSWFGDDAAARRRDRDERQEYRGRGHRDERATEVMTRRVETVHPRDMVETAARLMRDRDVGAIPVATDDGRMVGMITDRDIVVRLVADGRDARTCPVHEVMTERIFAGRPDDRIEDLMQLMARHRTRRLPILDDRDRTMGIVSQADLARHAGEHVGSGHRREFADMMEEVSERSRREYRG